MNWKIGTAKAVITPKKAVWLAGYGSKRAPEGIIHDLWLKVLAFEDSKGNRAVMVTTDHMGIPKGMYESMYSKLHARFKLDRSQVMFTFSHNHCGPRLHGDLVDYYPVEEEQVALVDEYSDVMESITIKAVAEALANLAPANIVIGTGEATFAVNRRNNPEKEVPQLLASGTPLKGPVDHTVPVLAVYRDNARLDAVLFGYACHPTTLSFTSWCGDYPGFAQIALEKKHPGVMAMFFNTCGADQNPLPRRELALCEKYGLMLAEAVDKVLAQPLTPVAPGLRTAFEFVDLDYLKVMSREELQQGAASANALYARWASRLLKKLDAGEKFASSYSYPVQAWKFGNELLVIGMGGEVVVDYALRFKQEFGANTWVCGYANDLVAYIPSLRVYNEGGYEGGAFLYEYGHPAVRWAPDIEDRLVAAVRRVVAQNQGAPRTTAAE